MFYELSIFKQIMEILKHKYQSFMVVLLLGAAPLAFEKKLYILSSYCCIIFKFEWWQSMAWPHFFYSFISFLHFSMIFSSCPFQASSKWFFCGLSRFNDSFCSILLRHLLLVGTSDDIFGRLSNFFHQTLSVFQYLQYFFICYFILPADFRVFL